MSKTKNTVANVDEELSETVTCIHVSEIVNWYNHFGKTVKQYLVKLNMCIWTGSSTPIYLSQRNSHICLPRDI